MNEVLMNPRWPKTDLEILNKSAMEVLSKLNLKDHKVIASSGSSAKSFLQTKLIYLSEDAFLESARAVNNYFELSSADIWGQCLPLFHVGGLGVEYRAKLTQSSIVQMLLGQKWDAAIFYKLLVQENITVTSLVPTQLYDLLLLNLNPPPKLRWVFIGGGSIDETLFLNAQKLKWPLVLTYGMTETCSMVASSKKMNADLEFKNFLNMQSLPHAEYKIDSEGFIEIKGASLLTSASYIDLQNVTQIQVHAKNDFYKTSDKALKTPKGEFQILGRESDFVKISGESVGLTHLRDVLNRAVNMYNGKNNLTANVKDFALKAVFDPRRGQRIVIYSCENKEAVNSICELYNDLVRPFERVGECQYVSEIPRSDLGKILWEQLDRFLL